ncbi:MAG: hypothetical protein H6R04_1564 [Burkholderiaceae bacterium]|nr:hypothetical protein [Burkholderiaceae bacterium]
MDQAAIRQSALNLVKKPITRRIAIGIVGFFILFGLIGYFALPGIIKSKAETLLTEKLKRPATIERIDISPYAMVVTIHKLKMLEPDGKTTFVSFDEMELNLSLQSLFRFAPVIEEFRLKKPYVHLARTSKNRYSIDDILAELAKQPPSDEPPRFSVYNIQIEDGLIEFDDQPEKTVHKIAELKLGIPFISSLPSKVDVFVEPLLSANVNGSPFQLKGKAHPFGEAKDAVIDIDLDAVALPRYLEYLPFEPQFKLPEGALDVHLSASFRQPKGEARTLLLKGDMRLKNLRLTEPDGKPMLRLPELVVTLDELQPLSGKLDIAKVALNNPELNIVKARNGALNLLRLAPPASPASPAAETKTGDTVAEKAQPPSQQSSSQPALQIALHEFAIKGGMLKYDDQQTAQPMTAGADKFDLAVRKIALDLRKREATIAEVHSDGAALQLIHGKRGQQAAAKGSSAKTVKSVRPALKKAPEKEAPGFAVAIGKIAIANWSAQLEDRNLKKPAVTRITPLALSAENISNSAGSQGKIDLRASVNKGGTLAISGSIGLAPLQAKLALDLKGVDIMAAQPYFTDQVNLLLTSANVSAKGSLQISQTKSGALNGSFNGNAGLGQVATVDKLSANDFARWKSLSFTGVNLQLEPFSLAIDQVALNDFFARVIVSRQGRINLQDIVLGEDGQTKSLTETPDKADSEKAPQQETKPEAKPAAQAAAKAAPAKRMPPLKIKKLTLQGGKVRFSDYYIKPNYNANLVGLGGVVTGLSSAASTTANVDLRGQVNSAPLTINGKVNPLKGDLFLDLKAAVKGMELAPLSAYSGKYVGYGIEKGKLSFDVAYKVENRQLTAENRLVLDQLTFGDKVESKDALNVPVHLAVALLRDRNGVIDLNLPIGGSLDDPQFSMGAIIVKVIVNLITKAVTAPFALLGSIFGGGEDLSWLNFDPGSATIAAAAESKLTALSKAMLDRPALKLEITGRADPETDKAGLARASIGRKVRALKLKDMVAKGQPVPPEGVTVGKDEYPALLKRAYGDEKFKKPRNLIGLAKDLPVAEMEKLMAENAKVTDDDLTSLGNRRAQAVKEWLLAKGVPAERMFLLASKPSTGADKQGPSRVDFSLR